MSSPRSLPQLRKLVELFRQNALKKGREAEMLAEWGYTYRPADNPEELKEIAADEFLAEPGSSYGHPRPGDYSAIAKDADTGEVLFDQSGEWLADMGGLASPDEEKEGIAGMLAAITKSTRQTLNNSADVEAAAVRRAAQAEARERANRRELEDTLGAMDGLRKDLHAARVLQQTAEADALEAQAQRDAALAEMDEMRRTGAELAAPMDAMAAKMYRFVCLHFGEDPIALETDMEEKALRIVCEKITKWTCETWIAIASSDGTGERPVMVALLLHHSYGLPWPLLRVIFHALWGVFLADAPAVDWTPPEVPAPAAPAVDGDVATVH